MLKYWPAALTKTNRENKNVKHNIYIYTTDQTFGPALEMCLKMIILIRYNKTCIKRSPLVQKKSGIVRQVTP
jgi:hypothetical protein